MIGTNDARASVWKDSDTFLSEYKKFVKTYLSGLNSTPEVFLASVTPLMEEMMPEFDPPLIPRVSNQYLPEVIPIAAKELGFNYIDVFHALGGNDKSLWEKYSQEFKGFKKNKSDGIHWGYPQTARTIFKAIQPTVLKMMN